MAFVAPCLTEWNWFPITITRPAAGPQPTLLMRQPYGRDIASTVVYAHPAGSRGMATTLSSRMCADAATPAAISIRFSHEGRDGAETIAWLRSSP